jgi:hypothetical protein
VVAVAEKPEALPHYLVPTSRDRQRPGTSTFTLGVDLGQSIDPTAMTLIERRVMWDGKSWTPKHGRQEGATDMLRAVHLGYWIRAVELLPLQTRYQTVVTSVAERLNHAAELGACELVFDETGNRAAGDMLRAAVPNAIACVISGGESDNSLGSRRFSLSKANMVSGLLAGIEVGDLKLATDLTDMDQFTAHLVDLRRKISSLGHSSFNAAEGKHDDYVTAAGLAWWRASRKQGVARRVRVKGI